MVLARPKKKKNMPISVPSQVCFQGVFALKTEKILNPFHTNFTEYSPCAQFSQALEKYPAKAQKKRTFFSFL